MTLILAKHDESLTASAEFPVDLPASLTFSGYADSGLVSPLRLPPKPWHTIQLKHVPYDEAMQDISQRLGFFLFPFFWNHFKDGLSGCVETEKMVCART